jgi:hypothetical protein
MSTIQSKGNKKLKSKNNTSKQQLRRTGTKRANLEKLWFSDFLLVFFIDFYFMSTLGSIHISEYIKVIILNWI